MQVRNRQLHLNNFNLAVLESSSPILYRFLLSRVSGGAAMVLVPPSDIIGNRALYLQGLQLYLEACAGTVGVGTLTEQQVYQMAVIAYTWQALEPLLRLADRLEVVEDRYYYIYLARNPTVFNYVMADEIVRRETYPLSRLKINQRLEKLNFGYKEFDEQQGFLEPRVTSLGFTDGIEFRTIRYADSEQLRLVLLNKRSFKPSDIIDFVLDTPGVVVAGSAVTAMINSAHKIRNLLTIESDLEGLVPNSQIRNGIEAMRKGKFDQYLREYGSSASLERFESEAMNLMQSLFFINHVPYLKEKQPKEPIYVYFVGKPDYQKLFQFVKHMVDFQAVLRINEYALELVYEHQSIFLVMQPYESVEQILIGSDLDSDKIAFYKLQNRYEFKYTESFAESVLSGINAIVPARASGSFNNNLIRARDLGFEPYLPAALPQFLLIRDQYLTQDVNSYTYLKVLVDLLGNQIEPSINFNTQDYERLDPGRLDLIDPTNIDLQDLTLMLKQVEHNYNCMKLSLGGNPYLRDKLEELHAKLLAYYQEVFTVINSNLSPSLTNQFKPSTADYLGLKQPQRSAVETYAQLPTVLVALVAGMTNLYPAVFSQLFTQGVTLNNELAAYCQDGRFIRKAKAGNIQELVAQAQAQIAAARRRVRPVEQEPERPAYRIIGGIDPESAAQYQQEQDEYWRRQQAEQEAYNALQEYYGQ